MTLSDQVKSYFVGDVHKNSSVPDALVMELCNEYEELLNVILDVLKFRVGDLPTFGYIRDNYASRDAIGRLAALATAAQET